MNQKLISFCVPCYNSEKDMKKCLDSLITQKDKVEIIVVNDGSKDRTGEIADEYEALYPETIKVIHKENGGHGSGINSALAIATGLYFKVIDSDDWVHQEGYELLLSKIEKFGDKVDMYVSNYAYVVNGKVARVIKYNKGLRGNEIFGWDKVKHFPAWEYLTLHSSMYRTKLLQDIGIKLPEKVFYEDNYFIYCGLPHVKTIYYMPSVFYMYFIGREGQSVSREVSCKRFKDHYLAAHMMNNEYNPFDYKKQKGLYRTMLHHLVMVNITACFYTRLANTKESLELYHNFKREMKQKNKKFYNWLRFRTWGSCVMTDGFFGKALMRFSLWVCHLVVPFN